MILNVCVCLHLHWDVITILVFRVNLFRVIVNLSIDSAQTLRSNVFQHAPRLVHNRIPVGILWSSTFITYSQVLLFIREAMHFCVLVFIYIFFFLWIPCQSIWNGSSGLCLVYCMVLVSQSNLPTGGFTLSHLILQLIHWPEVAHPHLNSQYTGYTVHSLHAFTVAVSCCFICNLDLNTWTSASVPASTSLWCSCGFVAACLNRVQHKLR